MTGHIELIASALCLFIAWFLLRRSRRLNADAVRKFHRANDLLSEAEQVGHGQLSGGASIEVKHVSDPILRPLKMLVVMMPDADFEEVKESGKDEPVDAVPTTRGGMAALQDADFVVAVWADGTVRALKWRDYPLDVIEPEAYVGAP